MALQIHHQNAVGRLLHRLVQHMELLLVLLQHAQRFAQVFQVPAVALQHQPSDAQQEKQHVADGQHLCPVDITPVNQSDAQQDHRDCGDAGLNHAQSPGGKYHQHRQHQQAGRGLKRKVPGKKTGQRHSPHNQPTGCPAPMTAPNQKQCNPSNQGGQRAAPPAVAPLHRKNGGQPAHAAIPDADEYSPDTCISQRR